MALMHSQSALHLRVARHTTEQPGPDQPGEADKRILGDGACRGSPHPLSGRGLPIMNSVLARTRKRRHHDEKLASVSKANHELATRQLGHPVCHPEAPANAWDSFTWLVAASHRPRVENEMHDVDGVVDSGDGLTVLQ